MPTIPLIQDCVLIALDTVAFEVTGNAAIANCLTDAPTTVYVNSGTAYVLDNEGNTYGGGGTVEPFASDRSAFDALAYAARHTNDADVATTSIHHTLGTGADQAAAGNHTHSGLLSNALTNTHIFVGNISNVATDVAMSNDATMANTGAITLKNTGPGATGPIGSATVAPIITIDAQGRVTALSSATISAGGGQIIGIARWSASASQTTFDLPDTAEQLNIASDNGSIVDPYTVTLATGNTQMVFDVGITAGHIVFAEYVIAQI